MNDTELTVVGNVVDSPRRVRTENSAVTNFRMASTARRYDSGRQEFVDAGTLWVDVEAWGELGGNVARSVSKGDPVIVRGAIATDSWETETGRRSAPKVKAVAVGLNLARGHADFHKQVRSTPAAGAPALDAPYDGSGEPGDDTFDDLTGRSTDYLEGEETLDPVDSETTDERTEVPALT